LAFGLLLAQGCNYPPRIHHPIPESVSWAPGESEQATLLIPSAAELDFGALPRAGRREVTFWLRNPGQEAVEVGAVQTSCDCFQVALQKAHVAPGEGVLATATIDLSQDPRFTGRLRLEASGLAKLKTATAFAVCAHAEVK
jgi:hypothetical protein